MLIHLQINLYNYKNNVSAICVFSRFRLDRITVEVYASYFKSIINTNVSHLQVPVNARYCTECFIQQTYTTDNITPLPEMSSLTMSD